MARTFSKSKLLAFRQCPKRLWLELHRPELNVDSAATQASFNTGHRVGDLARHFYDPNGQGALIDAQTEGFDAAFARTQSLLNSNQPIFEAGFRAAGVLAFADVLLPLGGANERSWHMIEVKSSTSVKDYHRDDAAIQSFTARAAGVRLAGITLAHINSAWIYGGNNNYNGLFSESDLTAEAVARGDEVRGWIRNAQQIAVTPAAPAIRTGKHCNEPFACGFLAHCQEPQATHPIHWLPGRLSKALALAVARDGLTEMRDAPDELLNDRQQRVKTATLSGKAFFDQPNAARALATCTLPAYFMDFETIQFAVPIWKGTRPYQQIPFQFSVHQLTHAGLLSQKPFLDLSGNDPSRAFAQALIEACGQHGTIFVYNAGFETARIRDLAERFPDLATGLFALNERVFDLLPIAREYYYHPSQKGSWSIKAVLPALCPELDYEKLEGVQNGGMAMDAFMQAIAPDTSAERKAEIERQLLAYCTLDTFAMVRMWEGFSGHRQLT